MDFLIDEVRLLESELLEEWTELFTTDIVYQMPVRRTVLRGTDAFDPSMMHFDEGLASLKLRVRRVLHTTDWAEEPPNRVRRFLTNVRVYETESSGEYEVIASLLLTRNRMDESQYALISAERRDILRRDGPEWRIARRTILIDQALIGMPNLALFI